MKIYYERRGRLGNNIFEYLVAKIFQKMYHGELCLLENFPNTQVIIIDEQKFMILENEWKRRYEDNKTKNLNEEEWFELFSIEELKNKNIYLGGYFQRFFLLNVFRNYIKGLFSKDNQELIYGSLRVCDFLNCKNVIRPEKEIVMHIRLDDFAFAGPTSNIMLSEFYENFIQKYPECNFTIVCDKVSRANDILYLNRLSKYPNVSFHQKSIIEDFYYLMKSEYVISSNSTFSYIALMLGDAKKVIFPKNSYYSHQEITEIRGVETLFEECKY